MALTVQYTAQLKAVLGTAEETLDTSNDITGREFIDLLVEKHGDNFRSYALGEDGHLNPSLICCLDDQQIDLVDETNLPAGSIVTLLSAISGG